VTAPERAGERPGAREPDDAREPASSKSPARSTPGWEHFEVEADVGVRAWGASRAEAFARAAEGVFALVVAPAAVATTETREARAQGASLEALLVNWLNECLYVHEIEGFAVARVEVDTDHDDLVHGVLHGEPLDPARHPLGTIVKAVTHHEVEVRESPGRVDVRVVVDV
jgi:SHS2 domain-containing protein